MNKNITFCIKGIFRNAIFALVLVGGAFVVLPILGEENNNIFAPTVAYAQWGVDDGSGFFGLGDFFDSGEGFSAGYAGTGCCEAIQYASDPFSYPPVEQYPYDNGEGFSAGYPDAGCCEAYTYPEPTYNPIDNGEGFSAGYPDAGCCETYAYPEYTPTYAYPEYTPEYTYPEAYAYAPSYSYDYSYPNYSTYSTPSYYTPTYTYTQPTYTYSQPTYTPTYTPPVYQVNPRCTLYVDDNTLTEGQSTTLRWTTDNATRVTISNEVNSTGLDGSRTIRPATTRTYVLVATGPGGFVSCSETVNVSNRDTDNVRCDAFTVSDSSVDDGDSVTLEWRTTGADDVDISNGVGDVEDDGSERVRITRDTTFTLTARDGSDTDTCRVSVDVDEDDDTNVTNPRCELTASDTDIESGDRVTLRWDNTRANDIILRDNHGNTIADSRRTSSIDADRDSVIVRPNQDTTFTLTAIRGSREDECRVTIDVDRDTDITITSTRTQDGIYLSQVPYTGFEAGPVLTFIFYTAIALWGIFLAYFLVLKKKPALASQVYNAQVTSGVVSASVVDTTETLGSTQFLPMNLPTEEGEETIVAQNDSLRVLEEHAHAQSTLISSDALRFIESQSEVLEEQVATLDRVIALAKARFPKEDEWMVINKERVISLLG